MPGTVGGCGEQFRGGARCSRAGKPQRQAATGLNCAAVLMKAGCCNCCGLSPSPAHTACCLLVRCVPCPCHCRQTCSGLQLEMPFEQSRATSSCLPCGMLRWRQLRRCVLLPLHSSAHALAGLLWLLRHYAPARLQQPESASSCHTCSLSDPCSARSTLSLPCLSFSAAAACACRHRRQSGMLVMRCTANRPCRNCCPGSCCSARRQAATASSPGHLQRQQQRQTQGS
jgi:hypothetical protein